ncbi:metallophosphoesterase [Mycobacterium phage Astro]|uniref:Metallophosphoesterase n=4 Tax=Fromanvirus TaxID=186764 RepID=G8IRD1_9CAUD|nr:metallophosphoesterase [Mycobacterium phage Smeadley]YP_009638313.1 metallophosphoesterase [Mycobacterium phage Saintus]YP_009638511.1 metallophosphoesterase [Mycobacterium phage Astro]AXQ63559.1 metallophosphoesterase [Mycobacterium phage Dixon]AYD86982.1 metallophosphoesterase [Mycobacterium phage NearlyHeadless]QBI96648.1 metallophosphoesterase [Mycobacterium phage Expelliarmus]QDH93004.1 metallophosphoesterase [Mycobacterium phage Stephig9]QHB36946.1 metallophosphoesterase [Mycobacter
MTERIVFISDTQIPYDDRKALKAVVRFIGDYQPTRVIQIGDLMDFPQPSRWSAGTKAEFEGSIFQDCEQAKRRFLEPLRDVYDGPVSVHEGNHDERARVYLQKNSPALAETEAFNIENLLDFDGFGIDLLPEFYKVAPGWISTHGHRGGIGLSRIAGNTALNAAKKMLSSVVMGHTHRLGIGSYTYGAGGESSKVVTGMEVGNLMNMKLATYLKGGTANWQQGFGLMTVEGQHVKAETIPIIRGKFSVDGRTWEV